MAIDNLVTVKGRNLRNTFKRLRSGTMLHVDQLMNECRNNPKLGNGWFYTADGAIYFLDGAKKTPTLALTRGVHNPILLHIDEFRLDSEYPCTDGHLVTDDYRLSKAEVKQALTASDTVLVALSDLCLDIPYRRQRYGSFAIRTTSPGYEKLNDEQRRFAERVCGQENDFVQNMEMFKNADIGEIHIQVLNAGYVQTYTTEDVVIVRASTYVNFRGTPYFDFYNESIEDSRCGVHGHINLPLVTKNLILSVAKPYIASYNMIKFSERISDHLVSEFQYPALEDVLLAAHKDGFVCEHSTPEFDGKMRELYFPFPKKDRKE